MWNKNFHNLKKKSRFVSANASLFFWGDMIWSQHLLSERLIIYTSWLESVDDSSKRSDWQLSLYATLRQVMPNAPWTCCNYISIGLYYGLTPACTSNEDTQKNTNEEKFTISLPTSSWTGFATICRHNWSLALRDWDITAFHGHLEIES